MTTAEALARAVRRLRAAGIDGAPRDARRLLAHALGVAEDRLTLHLPEALPEGAGARLEAALDRRAAGVPVAQITGRRLFWGREFRVTPEVLDPRPETEALIAAALAAPFARVLDLGTGSGCILLTLLAERAGATGLGIDISGAALAVARENARALGVAGRARFVRGDWWAPVAGRFDLIVANPPYIGAGELAGLAAELRHEPPAALSPGADALAAFRAIARGLAAHLRPGGRALIEIGAGQGGDAGAILAGAGLDVTGGHDDLDGRVRVVEARAGAAA